MGLSRVVSLGILSDDGSIAIIRYVRYSSGGDRPRGSVVRSEGDRFVRRTLGVNVMCGVCRRFVSV